MCHLCPWNRLCSTATLVAVKATQEAHYAEKLSCHRHWRVQRVDGHLEWDIDSLFAHVKRRIPYERRDSHGARRDRRSSGCARTPEELMADMDKALSLCPAHG